MSHMHLFHSCRCRCKTCFFIHYFNAIYLLHVFDSCWILYDLYAFASSTSILAMYLFQYVFWFLLLFTHIFICNLALWICYFYIILVPFCLWHVKCHLLVFYSSQREQDVYTTSPNVDATSWRCNDVEATLYERHDVLSTLRRRCINVMCPLFYYMVCLLQKNYACAFSVIYHRFATYIQHLSGTI